MPNVQNFDIVAGETRTLTMYARDPDNAVQSLSGLTVQWRVGRAPWDPMSDAPVITKTGSIVSASAGSFTVSLIYDDTYNISGDFQHLAVTSSGLVVVSGKLHVRPGLRSGT
jgi:hypothetical protein